MIIDKTNFKIPDEFDEDFFLQILKNGFNISNVKIAKITLTMGSSGGDNYCSKIYRVKIELDHFESINKIFTVIIKYMSDMLTSSLLDQFYKNELDVYIKVLPHLENLFNEDIKFGPKYYFHSEVGNVPIIVMEDLGLLNFIVADRLTGMNELQAKVVLHKLAKFHAGSMVLAEKNPGIFNSFKMFLFQDRKEEMDEKRRLARDNIFYGNIKHIIQAFEKFPEFQLIMEKLKKLTIQKMYKLIDNAINRTNCIKVLNHGDMWVNNVLILNENEIQSKDAVFVDFQISYYGSLGLDLQYFMNTSLQADQHYNRNNLIEFYCEKLQNTLNDLNYTGTIPNLNDVQREINECEIVGFMAAEIILLVISIDRNESKDNSFNTFLDKEKIQQQLINVLTKNKRVIEILKTTIKRCDDLKLFD